MRQTSWIAVLVALAVIAIIVIGAGQTALPDDNVFLGSSNDIALHAAIPDCDTAGSDKLLYDTTTNAFTCGTDNAGGGSAIIFDIGDDGGDDSIDLNEIATTGDTNSIFTESAADKMLIALANNWPTADAADALSADPTDCAANQFAVSIVANGNLTCTSVDISDDTNLIADDGLLLTGDELDIDLVTAGGDGDSATTQSDSGLEIVANEVTLLRGCSDNFILKWDETADDWNCESDATGAGGSAIVFDIGDDGGDDSVDVNEIATTGDTNTIFTEPSADKILIAVGNNWPTADVADFVALDDIGDPASDASITFGPGEGLRFLASFSGSTGDQNFFLLDSSQTDDADGLDDLDVFRIELNSISGDVGDTYEGIVISQEATATDTIIDAALRIENLENAASTMTAAIIVEGTTSGSIDTALDVSDAEITTGIDIGANAFVYSTGSLSSADLELLDDTIIDISSETNLTCGTNCTLTGDAISVDDSFILNTGDVGTGVFDFGGATSFEIVNGAANTVNADGEIAHDTTADQIIFGADPDVLDSRKTQGITVETPADADNILIPRLVFGITILTIECIIDPADTGESVVITLQERDATADNPAGIDGATTITCDNDGATDDGTLSNAVVDADDWMSLDIGTVTGTVTFLSVAWEATITRE